MNYKETNNLSEALDFLVTQPDVSKILTLEYHLNQFKKDPSKQNRATLAAACKIVSHALEGFNSKTLLAWGNSYVEDKIKKHEEAQAVINIVSPTLNKN